MNPGTDEDLERQLPLPLAQLYRRALNAKTPLDRHQNAFYLAEATLKLAASLRIGVALAHGLEPRSPLAQSLEQLCLPALGHWACFLRETSEYLSGRPDAALLPLADLHQRLVEAAPLAEVRAFGERASGGESPLLTPDQVRDSSRQGVLGFFNLLVTTATRSSATAPSARRSSMRSWDLRCCKPLPPSCATSHSSAN